MIEINLLPPELRVKKKEPMKLPSLPIIPVAAGVVCLLIAIQVLLWLFIQVKSVSRDSLKKKIASIAASNKDAMTIDSSLREISSRVEVIGKLLNSRFDAAKKLNDLSDSMVSGIWLRSINVKVSKETLIIEGSNIVIGDSGEGSISKFVNSLKENESFSSDFDDIELAKVERRKVQNTEIMDFVIICHLKKGKEL
ncbi:MAG: hypothetical protein A3F87_03540 [Omnitrophica WOR_2 bacterium RIFCSPLOWO2_12_FULL_51_24]|nr:MAG: hypothetical protein A2879_00200 [Omnitrophica WOR_2 bacterium RIFCSPHIGHO2_01_FULL_49_10]OGX35800.1 MAG: hypothetical protein A3I43_01845 [Omnitrophica WOR_2 bacterium RIFCSPLOWO2_02_FULL_50_19]OGX43743.1 MAG: hypothetical protein A3F87_03540 [Omnitrophica WOR_2 bacterium RIFCSPLOWO2_12_FULL_51_24]